MKLLILAQTPPPLHGQSLMVRTAVDGLPGHGIEVHHVNLRLSRDHADIGGWRPGKILAVLDACFHAVVARFAHGCDTLYYVPAPGKRGALYRDWMVMALCRPFFRRLVLHFHNGGLGEWIEKYLTAPERWITQLLLGRADLAIVLTPSLCTDASALEPARIAVVPNGIVDPGATTRSPGAARPLRALFLGRCSDDKGLFDAATAVLTANAQLGLEEFQLVAAGGFSSPETERRFTALAQKHPGTLRHAGFVAGANLEELWSTACCLILPTRYPFEAQPLVVLEAMARGVPVIATRWRGIPETVPPADQPLLVAPGDIAALTDALLRLRETEAPQNSSRAYFQANFTLENHLARLTAVLAAVD